MRIGGDLGIVDFIYDVLLDVFDVFDRFLQHWVGGEDLSHAYGGGADLLLFDGFGVDHI